MAFARDGFGALSSLSGALKAATARLLVSIGTFSSALDAVFSPAVVLPFSVDTVGAPSSRSVAAGDAITKQRPGTLRDGLGF